MKTILWLVPVCFLGPLSAALAFDYSNAPSGNLVLGHADFLTNDPGTTATTLKSPSGVAISPVSGKVFVADTGNSRVLRYASASSLANGAAAEGVLGQADFTSGAGNRGGTAQANTLKNPYGGVFVDAADRLWVSDTSNNRVLRFEGASTIANGAAASVVLGQPDFTTATSNTTAQTMNGPDGIAMDANGTLWVTDFYNSRVLRFGNAADKANGAPADGVLGQPGFTTMATAPRTASSMAYPSGVALDAAGTLWVVDQLNNRVLRFTDAAFKAGPTGAAADSVVGQIDATSNGTGSTAAKLADPTGVFVGPDGRLWVVDNTNARVLGFTPAASATVGGSADVVIGQPDFTSNIAANPPTASSLRSPYIGLFVDASGNVWVADSNNHRVLRFPPRVSTPNNAKQPNIDLKGKLPKVTTSASLEIEGTASLADGSVTAVLVKQDGKTKKAKGTTSWTYKAKLTPGTNVLTIVALGSNGAASRSIKIKITRK